MVKVNWRGGHVNCEAEHKLLREVALPSTLVHRWKKKKKLRFQSLNSGLFLPSELSMQIVIELVAGSGNG